MRRAGHWDEAREYYRQAVTLNQETGQDWDLALAFNNLGYIEALRGRYERSILLLENALRVYEDLGDAFMVSVCSSNLGEAHRYALSSYETTMACYDRALSIFEDQRHTEWLSKVYQKKAIAELQLGAPPDVDYAWRLVMRSIELCRTSNPADLASALNRAGRIAQARGKLKQAEQLLQEGVERAEEVDDVWFIIANLVHLAELIYSQVKGKSIETLENHLTEIEGFNARLLEYVNQEYKFPDLYGRMEIILGHLKYDLGIKKPDQELLSAALNHYVAAFPQLALGFYASHGVRALPGELDEFRSRIEDLLPETAMVWCNRLKEVWGGLIEIPSLPSFAASCSTATKNRLSRREVQSVKD
jgi:tetratricopeptide (TPR) repeat protein